MNQKTNIIDELIICAGFGGQGIMVLGKVLANAAMEKGFFVTWLPAYGAEVRGGTAYSMVRASVSPIASPVIEKASTLIVMNEPSLDRFENNLSSKGLLIVNTSLVKRRTVRKDVEVVNADLTNEAVKLGNIRVANMIAAGVFMAKKNIFDKNILISVIENMAAGREELVAINIKAVEKGLEIAGRFAS
ncbi:MAG: 2-oxoacid:acceptor oxidoreductase family protein [Candidatus Omnitrophota bacterium]